MWRGHEGVLTQEQLQRRAGGRRHYNSWRQFLARLRQGEVITLVGQGVKVPAIAAQLQVNPSTIRRDIQAVLQGDRKGTRCPMCGRAWDAAVPRGYEP
jgi:hypothetical protein